MVQITEQGFVIFTLILKHPINTPVALLLRYSEVTEEEEGGMVRRSNTTTIVTFNGTDVIIHTEANSDIPYQRFRVEVALISRELDVDVIGPFNELNQIFGKKYHLFQEYTLLQPHITDI